MLPLPPPPPPAAIRLPAECCYCPHLVLVQYTIPRRRRPPPFVDSQKCERGGSECRVEREIEHHIAMQCKQLLRHVYTSLETTTTTMAKHSLIHLKLRQTLSHTQNHPYTPKTTGWYLINVSPLGSSLSSLHRRLPAC